ncbi:alpha-amylase family glycosyl hydrolase [Microbacterium amylolyticum]|uniref:1,4-alpha-D-glucan glucanohydrolase n=1 Tax=Microbacterium amylolyticum TaxID=936337 RepID=A0ABS4ZH37_9MICO|nr:alpha-amylase family glycosyl hydrolase [Microbacterium amylolyticum]MBP2436595.1 glycosidase/fibronectin type 3 domain-containing protein [Microbacterium amylolyticum]
MNPQGMAVDSGKRGMRRWFAALVATLMVTAGLVSFTGAEKAVAAAPGPKDTIAVLFSYTWNKIAEECENTLGPAGYGYVQTSPPQEHVMVPSEGNPWWIYYQPVSYKLESRMGTEAEFESMISRCNAAGVGVIVDAVINHMSGAPSGGTGWAGTQFQYYNYPGLYGDSDFHDCRRDINNYQDRWEVQECQLVGLSDLKTSSPSVQQKLADYLNKFIDMGAAGFRIDAVKHIAASDMNGIMSRVNNRDDIYVVQEVIRANEPIQPEEYLDYGDVHEFAYARKLQEAFGGSRIDWLISGAGIGSTWEGFLPQANAAVFVDNHDTERNGETLSYKNGRSYDLAQIFTLAWNYGSPSIHSGYEFSGFDAAPAVDGQGRVIDPQPGTNGWTFKHAQNDIQNMVGFRNETYGTAVVNKWSSADGSAIAFGRGDKGYVAINNGSGSVQREFTTSLPDGEYYNVIKATRTGDTWSGESVVVSGGKFTANLGAKDAIALHAGAKVDPGCEDAANPTVPTNVTATGTTVQLSWNDSTDDCQVAGYQITRTGGAGGSVTLNSTTTSLTDSGLAANTAYSYTVRARDTAGKLSGASSAASATTGEGPQTPVATVYYQVPSGWSAANMHYRVGSGAWTDAPGESMSAVDGFAGWFQLSVDVVEGESVTAAFNNGAGVWDNNGSQDYVIPSGGDWSVSGGSVSAGKPEKAEPLDGELSLFYKPAAGWGSAYAHYQVGSGEWTAVPGVQMTSVASCEAGSGWYHLSVDSGAASSVTVAFNNGSGTWDNNGSSNYTFTTATAAVSGGAVSVKDPCASVDDDDEDDVVIPGVPSGVTVVPSESSVAVSWPAVAGATSYRVAYRATASSKTLFQDVPSGTSAVVSGLNEGTAYWFKVSASNSAGASAFSAAAHTTTGSGDVVIPGVPSGVTVVPSESSVAVSWPAVAGATSYRVAYRATASSKTLFQDVPSGTSAVVSGLNEGTAYWFKVSASNSAGASAFSAAAHTTTGSGDVVIPGVPSGVSTVVSGQQVSVSWTAVAGATSYTISYSTGGGAATTVASTATATVITGLAASTTYSFRVRAENAAGNSAYSAAVTATTGEAPTDEEPGGSVAGATTASPLGGDPRKDAIYFIMTARWYDGDPSNNMGGALHEKSGNAANDDPMFRGDFQGIIDKLDYIKGLGFSALWITPVVTNRSDYDFHGYHGWDFQRIDPRLESPGATYQDLINEAHAKGIKIYQDVVYNHTSRWGEKNLYSATVYGKRDAEWSWYYDEPVPGKVYNPAKPQPDGSAYNGDLWSETQPADQNCQNWGVQSGYSAEGYKVYHCQWPNATSGMFPEEYFHPCWIGNWEGSDSKDCWIHEDLADLNTESAVVQDYLIDTYNKYIDMGVDGFRVDTAVHIPRVMWNRYFLPALQEHAVSVHGEKGKDFYVFGEVAQFVHDKWNRGSVNHSAPFYTWKERREYSPDDVQAVIEQYQYENLMGGDGQPRSANAFLDGNNYRTPDYSQFSGMHIIDMRMHMNFDNAHTAFHSGMDSDDVTNDATFNAVYVDSHDYGPGKSNVRFDGGTAAWAENMSLMWTFRGIPVLYYGSEIEFQAGQQIDCGPSCPLETTGRAYFGDHLEGNVVASDFGVVSSASGAVATTLAQPLSQHLQTLNRIRRGVPALQMGQYSTEGVSGGMAFKRRYAEGSTDSFVLVTISGGATFSGIPNGTYVDAVTGDTKVVSNGTLSVSLSGQGNMRAYVLNGTGKIGDGSPYLN